VVGCNKLLPAMSGSFQASSSSSSSSSSSCLLRLRAILSRCFCARATMRRGVRARGFSVFVRSAFRDNRETPGKGSPDPWAILIEDDSFDDEVERCLAILLRESLRYTLLVTFEYQSFQWRHKTT